MKKFISILMAMVLVMGLLTGCQKEKSNETANEGGSSGSGDSNVTATTEASSDEVTDIELWTANNGFKPIEKGSRLYDLYKDMFGVGMLEPYIEWDGGTNYLNQLNIRISADEMPDIFVPFNGKEIELAENGAVADLTDLLPEYAPNVWNNIPQEVWDIVKANDPTGQGRIYWIPQVVNYARTCGMIRQDWLDKLGLQMPTTQEELVNVLKAFKTQDPNGNGQQDELPTGGRADARWMDHLFLMYGVALDEGYPDWDVYNGEFTYAAITQNMKDALAFCAELYKEGLMDPESLLNDKTTWDSKIYADRVGVFYHWAENTKLYADNAYANSNVKQQWSVLPAIQVPGYEGKSFYPMKSYKSAQWCVKNNKDEKKLVASLKLLDGMYDPNNTEAMYFGAEGMHYEVVDGKKALLPTDMASQENRLEPWTYNATVDSITKILEAGMAADNEWSISQSIKNVSDAQQYAKAVAGAGMPASVYGDYPEIQNHTLYKEYATRIIIGEYSIDKFDEFVEKWYASGGEEVTKAAREWYQSVTK